MDASAVAQTFVLSLTIAGLYAAIASGLTLEFGVTRIVNFAHGEFVMLGAFITYLLSANYGVSPLLGMLVAGVAMAALSYVVFRLFLTHVLRHDEHNQLLATMGLSILLLNLALIVWGPDPRSLHGPALLPSVHLGSVVVPGNNLLALVVGGALYGALVLFVRFSRYGVQLRFASSDPTLAVLAGVNVERMFVLSFVIGGLTAGIAGGVVALVLYVHPLVGVDLVIRAFAIVGLGGMGSIPGALIGAVLLSMVESAVSTFVPGGASWGYGVAFLMIVAVLLIRPTGLMGEKMRA